MEASHDMVCPCTLSSACVVCPGAGELVGQHPPPISMSASVTLRQSEHGFDLTLWHFAHARSVWVKSMIRIGFHALLLRKCPFSQKHVTPRSMFRRCLSNHDQCNSHSWGSRMQSLWSACSNLLTIQFAGFIVRETYCEVDAELCLHTFAKTLTLTTVTCWTTSNSSVVIISIARRMMGHFLNTHSMCWQY